jgi:hypothetical protein
MGSHRLSKFGAVCVCVGGVYHQSGSKKGGCILVPRHQLTTFSSNESSSMTPSRWQKPSEGVACLKTDRPSAVLVPGRGVERNEGRLRVAVPVVSGGRPVSKSAQGLSEAGGGGGVLKLAAQSPTFSRFFNLSQSSGVNHVHPPVVLFNLSAFFSSAESPQEFARRSLTRKGLKSICRADCSCKRLKDGSP